MNIDPIEVPGYGGKYTISIEDGYPIIRRTERTVFKNSGEPFIRPAIELVQSKSLRGHMRVRLYNDNGEGTTYMVHRLMLLCGVIPAMSDDATIVDHIDGDKTNNHVSNLRLVNKRQNQLNRRTHREGALFGATYSKARSHLPTPWTSAISYKGKYLNLGHYATEAEAHEAYCRKHIELGYGDPYIMLRRLY